MIDKKVIIGKIVELLPHANAEKLRVAKIDIGEKIITVVCGASNIAVGQIVPIIFPGGKVSSGGEEITVEKRTIRGVESEAMMCSVLELGLGEDNTGIMVLPKEMEKSLGLSLERFYINKNKRNSGGKIS